MTRIFLSTKFYENVVNYFCYFAFIGMQDYNYLHTNSFEITLELSCDKFPTDPRLFAGYWSDNKASLLNYMLEV